MSGQLLIGDVFRAAGRGVPHRVAAALGDEQMTFSELDRRSDQLAHELSELGVGRGERMVTWSVTHLELCVAFAAAAKTGAVFAPASGLLSKDEARQLVGLARPSLLVVDPDRAVPGAELAEELGIPLLVLGEWSLDDDAKPFVSPAELVENDPHVVFFTSGSTGAPKGVVLSHRTNYLRTHPGSQLEERGPTVCMFPQFHMGSWTIAMQSWQAQNTVVFVERADAEALCNAIARWRATHFNAIPAVWWRILNHLAGRDDQPLASLHIADSGTSATPPELLDAIRDAVPQAIRRVFYGSTEGGLVSYLRDEEMDARPGSCGVPQHTSEVRVDADTGELQVRGPLVFDGYFDNPSATAAAFTADGFFRTGDLAAADADGFLSIVGRATDVIRTGGEAVAPTEVEQVLATHPAVADVAVVGLPDASWGELVCAVVVAADGHSPTLEELAGHCTAQLAGFKQPRRLYLVDAIPRTPATNQIQRRLILERLIS